MAWRGFIMRTNVSKMVYEEVEEAFPNGMAKLASFARVGEHVFVVY